MYKEPVHVGIVNVRSRWLAGGLLAGQVLALIVFGFVLDPASPLYPRCSFYQLTHLYCPGCGTGRGMLLILSGHLLEGLRQNILLLPGILLLAVFNVNLLFTLLGKQAPFPVQRWTWLGIGAVVVIPLYWLLRNLPWFPFTLLAPSVPLPWQ